MTAAGDNERMADVIPFPLPVPSPERLAAIWALADELWAQREAEREMPTMVGICPPVLRVTR